MLCCVPSQSQRLPGGQRAEITTDLGRHFSLLQSAEAHDGSAVPCKTANLNSREAEDNREVVRQRYTTNYVMAKQLALGDISSVEMEPAWETGLGNAQSGDMGMTHGIAQSDLELVEPQSGFREGCI